MIKNLLQNATKQYSQLKVSRTSDNQYLGQLSQEYPNMAKRLPHLVPTYSAKLDFHVTSREKRNVDNTEHRIR
jgi:tRNA U34 5-carboxymethylaminomethyl modifying GTPase MnmE/TrmE